MSLKSSHFMKAFKIFIFLYCPITTSCGKEFLAAPEPDRGFRLPETSSQPGTKSSSWPSKTCDADDVEIFKHKVAFSTLWRQCAIDAWGDKKDTSNCLRAASHFPNLHTSCADCFGAFSQCGKENCKSKCWWNSKSSKCQECGWANCRQVFESCTGFDRSFIADPPPG